MELRLEAKWLERFLDLKPKVFVAAGDPLAALGLDEAGQPLFDVWVFSPEEAAGWIVRPLSNLNDNADRVIAVPNPPAATIVPAVQTPIGCTSLEKLRDWWSANGPSPAAPVLLCPDSNTALSAILRELLGSAQRELVESSAQVTAATAQIYQLRCEQEQTRVAVEALQNETNRLRPWPQLMRVHLTPNGSTYAPAGGTGTIVQPAPVSAEGLAGIDLHFPPGQPVSANTQILVQLHAVDMGRDLGAWLLRSPHLGKGWVRCWFPEPLAVASHDLEVRVTWRVIGDIVPAISLASFGDWDERRARLQGSQESLDGSLALSLWAGGVPGTALKSSAVWCSPHADGSVEYRLGTEEIGRRMRLHVPQVAGLPAEWYPFQIRRDGSFMLHPVGEPATALLLTNGCTPDVDCITAFVKITSPHGCGPIQYAIGVSKSDEAGAWMDELDSTGGPRFLGFSGWHTIPRDNEPHQIVLDLARPLSESAHLILATRMPPGGDRGWAWADWLEVRLRVRGSQVPALEPVEASTQQRAA